MEPSEPSQWSKQTEHGSDCEMTRKFLYLLLLLLLSTAEKLR